MKFGCFPGPVAEGIDSWEKRLEQYMGRDLAAVGYLDMDRALLDSQIQKEHLFEGNKEGHWNPRGHQQVARYLEQFLREWKLVKIPGAGSGS